MKKLFVMVSLSFTSLIATNSIAAGFNQLYNNGPLITQSGTGVGGNDESVLENNTLSMNSFGTAHHPGANLRVADDFTVTAESWQINSIDFFAYQTNETASTITAINLRIWDGVPGSPGSTVVFGDTSTNRLNSTSFSGILRVNEDTQGIANDRQIAISNVLIDMEFTAGTYWLDWQAEGSGGSGPFVPHITIPGQDTTGNALLSTDNGSFYGTLQDLGSLTNQGLPFIINGTAGSIEPQSVPTLSLMNLMILVSLFLLTLYILQGRIKHNT